MQPVQVEPVELEPAQLEPAQPVEAAETNELGQPVGRLVEGWQGRPRPSLGVLPGRYCRLEVLDPDRHAAQLFAADRADTGGASWTYLSYGPFTDQAAFRAWVDEMAGRPDPFFYAIIDTDPISPTQGRALGVASYERISPEHGSIEVGHVHYAPALQRRRAASEAQFLLMAHAFDDLGYRRYEWKCDALNGPSRAAATRLGFAYEGTFAQHRVVRGRSRDTAWYAITDRRWPAVRAALQAWLVPGNFHDDGRQVEPLRMPDQPAEACGRPDQRAEATMRPEEGLVTGATITERSRRSTGMRKAR